MYDSCKNRKSEERKGKCRDFTCNSKADKVTLVHHKSRRELVCCDLFRGPRSSSASWCSTVCTTKHPSTSSTSASLSPMSPPDNIFALPAEVFSSCLAIVLAVMVGRLFLWPALRYGTGYQTVWEIRPSAETPSSIHLGTFFRLLVYIAH